MFKFELTDGHGRRITADQLKRQFERGIQSAVEEAKTKIGDEARKVVCPVHHQHPTLFRTAQGYDVKGCCPTLISAVKARLGR